MNQHQQSGPRFRFVPLVTVMFVLLAGLFAWQALPSNAQESDLTGDYAVSINRSDIPNNLVGGYSYVGSWQLSFHQDGSYLARRLDVGDLVSGTWESSGNKLTVTDSDGLLSCSQPSAQTIDNQDVSSGEYEWEIAGEQLTLTATDDQCQGRVVLFTTRPFGPFVPCRTSLSGTPIAEGSPALASPVAVTETPPAVSTASILDLLTPKSEPATSATPDDTAAVEAGVDDLLAQMTACWATGKPELFLPLLSVDFQQSLFTSDPDFENTMRAAMATPIVWVRSGDVQIDDPTKVTAVVKTTTGPSEDFVRFNFVLENGEWKWDG